MKKTTFKEFSKNAKHGNLVPICAEILGDFETPVSAFLKVASKAKSAFLLESVEYGEKLGRYSFIGSEPGVTVESKGTEIIIKMRGRSSKKVSGMDAVTYVQKMMKQLGVLGKGMGKRGRGRRLPSNVMDMFNMN